MLIVAILECMVWYMRFSDQFKGKWLHLKHTEIVPFVETAADGTGWKRVVTDTSVKSLASLNWAGINQHAYRRPDIQSDWQLHRIRKSSRAFTQPIRLSWVRSI